MLLRGLEKASQEWKLLAGCHNLLKLHSVRTNTATQAGQEQGIAAARYSL